MTALARWCSPTAATSTSTRRSRATGRSSRPTARTTIAVRHLLVAHRRALRLARAASPSRTSTTGRKPTRCSPRRRRGGSPARASGYHAITQGYLVGEVVRRVTGRTLGAFFADEIAGPLGADFHIGLAARARRPRRPRDPAAAAGRPTASTSARPDRDAHAHRNPPLDAPSRWTRARGGGPRSRRPNGHGNARSVASVQSVLACGGRSAACASCRRGLPTACSRSSATAPTSCSACRCGSASATGSRRRVPLAQRARLLLGRLGRLARRRRSRRAA